MCRGEGVLLSPETPRFTRQVAAEPRPTCGAGVSPPRGSEGVTRGPLLRPPPLLSGCGHPDLCPRAVQGGRATELITSEGQDCGGGRSGPRTPALQRRGRAPWGPACRAVPLRVVRFCSRYLQVLVSVPVRVQSSSWGAGRPRGLALLPSGGWLGGRVVLTRGSDESASARAFSA